MYMFSFSKNCSFQYKFPLIVDESFSCSKHQECSGFSTFFILVIVIDVLLLCSPLVNHKDEHILIYSLDTRIAWFCQVPANIFLLGRGPFFLLICRSSSCSLNITPLLDIWIVNTFFHFNFQDLMGVSWLTEFLIFSITNLS